MLVFVNRLQSIPLGLQLKANFGRSINVLEGPLEDCFDVSAWLYAAPRANAARSVRPVKLEQGWTWGVFTPTHDAVRFVPRTTVKLSMS